MPMHVDILLDPHAGDLAFMREQIGGITTERLRLKVSEWAEQNRYLPPDLTPLPGKWKNSVMPPMVEIMDCLSIDHPARKVVLEKGAQVTASAGLVENFIGYTVSHAPCGMIYINADKELAKIAMEMKVDAMLHHSGLSHLLKAADGRSKRSGDTSTFKQFPNGWLLGFGARSPGKLRSTSAKHMALDEIDGMPAMLGEEGSPITLADQRTVSYYLSRKVLFLSTPTTLQASQIHPLFLQGDQRYCYVPCVHCGWMQHLEWHGVNEDQKPYGFVFELNPSGTVAEGSVGYKCRKCYSIFSNNDKSLFLPECEWRPHAETQEKGLTSFHLPAFYSPLGMFPWEGIVEKWLKAWDVPNDRMKDAEELRAFYNLQRGLPWEERGESPSAQRVREHRRAIYGEGQIPNTYAIAETGAPVVLLTCAVDVHGERLDVEVLAWCQGRQTYSIEWLHFKGDPDDLSVDGPWEPLRRLIEDTEYVADDGRHYRIRATVIDAAWEKKQDAVYQFCQPYSGGVFPVMGRKSVGVRSAVKEFAQSESSSGNIFFNVSTWRYKDRLSAWLKSDWNSDGQLQPTGYPNYPHDRPDTYFKEYEAEEKIQLLDPKTKKHLGWEWRQIGSRPNHGFDCRIYGMCAFDMIVYDLCTVDLGLKKLDYQEFFNYSVPRKNERGHWMPAPHSYHPDQQV